MNACIRAVVLALGLQAALIPARAQGPAPEATTPAPPEVQAVLAAERARLERFLAGDGYNYFVLEMKLREVLAKVDALIAQGQYAAAEEALAPLAALRPLDDIPHMGLTMRRMRLMSEAEQAGRPVPAGEGLTQSLRYALMERVVAGDKDARSQASAIEVPFVEFEYFWMARRGLNRQTQRLLPVGDRSYDVLEVVDRKGQPATLYFDVTRLVKLRIDGIQQLKP